MGRTIFFMTVLTVLGKILGIVRESTLAFYFGVSSTTDAYLTAGSMGGIIFGWILSVYTCYTPVYVEICKSKSRKDGRIFTGSLIILMVLVYTLLALILFFGREFWIRLVVSGYSEETKEMTSSFLAIAAPGIIVVPVINLLKAYLDANGYFNMSLSTEVLFSMFQVGFIILAGVFGIHYLAYALIVPFLFQLGLIGLLLWRFKLLVPLKFCYMKEFKQIGKMLIPVCISSILVEISSFVDKSFASCLPPGSISAINYSYALRDSLMNVFMYAFVTVSFPLLSSYVAGKEEKKFIMAVQKGIRIIILVFIPLSIGSSFFSEDIIRVIYQRGSFGDESVLLTRNLLIIYLAAMLPLVVRTYILKVFYSLQDIRTPLIVSCIATGINILLNYLMIDPFGVHGIVLATTCSDMIAAVVMVINLKRKIVQIEVHCFIIMAAKCFISSLGMLMTLKVIKTFIINTQYYILVNDLICTFLGMIVYTLLCFLLKIDEVKHIIKH